MAAAAGRLAHHLRARRAGRDAGSHHDPIAVGSAPALGCGPRRPPCSPGRETSGWSGTSSARTSEASLRPGGPLATRRGAVLLVGHVLAPADGAARLVDLLHGQVGHEAVGCGAMPM